MIKIGHIVTYCNSKKASDRYIVLATEKQKLDIEYIKSLTGIFYIKNIENLANDVIEVAPGFMYKICKQANYYENGLCVLEGNYIDVLSDKWIAL